MKKFKVTIDGTEIEVISASEVDVEFGTIKKAADEAIAKAAKSEEDLKNTQGKNLRIEQELKEHKDKLTTISPQLEQLAEVTKKAAELEAKSTQLDKALKIHEVLGGKYTGAVISQLLPTPLFQGADLSNPDAFVQEVDKLFGGLGSVPATSLNNQQPGTPAKPFKLEDAMAAQYSASLKNK